jgi:hypothetical protein
MTISRQTLALARDGLEMLLDLAETGDLEKYGFPSSSERLDALLLHIADETVNILRAELETLAVEQRGKTGIKKVLALVEEARQIGIPLQPTIRDQMTPTGPTRKLRPKQEGT